MKNEPSFLQLINRVQALSPDLGGVFSFSDLYHLIGASSILSCSRTIVRLVKERVLIKLQRGWYVTPKPDLWVLASQLRKGGYISMDSVLVKEGLIGTVPSLSVSSVLPGGRGGTIQSEVGFLRFFSVKKELSFGIHSLPNGVVVADSEKAYLDLLYHFMKGARFVFDPLKEVDIQKLNRTRLNQYLKRYHNRRFIKFVKGVLNECS